MCEFRYTKRGLNELYEEVKNERRYNKIYEVCKRIKEAAIDGNSNYVINLPTQLWVGTSYDMTSEEVIKRIKEYFPDCDYSLSEGNLTVSWK